MKTKLLLFSALLAVFFSTSCNEAKPVLHTSPKFLAVVDSLCIENEYVDEDGYSASGVSHDFYSYLESMPAQDLPIFKDLPMKLISVRCDRDIPGFKAMLVYSFAEEDEKYCRYYGVEVEIVNFFTPFDEASLYMIGKKYYVVPGKPKPLYNGSKTEILGIQKSDEPKTRKEKKEKKIGDFRKLGTIALADATLVPAD